MAVEPVPDEPAAVAAVDDGRALVLADYHAGLEVALRYDGVELRSRAGDRRSHVHDLLDRTDADRVVVLGDLGHDIGDPGEIEREEIERLLESVTDRVPLTLVKGNHDGTFERIVEDCPGADITDGDGVRLGPVGFAHGHTWPAPRVLEADIVCVGHEHPMVRLEDEVGGSRVERAWLRGDLDPAPFVGYHDDESLAIDGELVVVPAFNDLTGGTWINVDGQAFLAPFLPEGIGDGHAYLLDGTRLGAFREV
jgi:putative SbcD/Mre11-related phosphoesterase